MATSALEKARTAGEEDAIVAPDSRQVTELLQEYGGGAVKVFGDPKRRSAGSLRTEVALKEGLVVIHKNLGNCGGNYGGFSIARFSEIEVVAGGKATGRLEIKVDPATSEFNPIYLFAEPGSENKVGIGYGQHIDLRLAEGLGVGLLGSDSYVDESVLNLVREKLTDLSR